MPFVFTAPCIERTGVVTGFVLSRNAYYESLEMLRPNLSIGVLFAQDTMYRPDAAPELALATANQQSWLFYNTSTGFYWADTPNPATSGDAFIGWVVADATKFVAISNQRIAVAGSGGDRVSMSGAGGLGGGALPIAGGDDGLVTRNGVPVTY